MDKIAYYLDLREEAKRRGDAGVYRAITADLARLGHIDPPEAASKKTRAPARRAGRQRAASKSS